MKKIRDQILPSKPPSGALKDIDWASRGLKLEKQNDRVQFYAALEFIEHIDVGAYPKVLDIGSGPGHQAFALQELGFDVTCVDFKKPLYPDMKWLHPDDLHTAPKADAVWSHHCLEHIRDPIGALVSWRTMLRPQGMLFLTVPHFGVTMSSGHINGYTLPLLMYHLAMAGYSCSDNRFIKRDSHLRAAVPRHKTYDPEKKIETGLSTLAKMGSFSSSVSKEIQETGRFTPNSIVLRWYDRALKPARGASESVSYAFDSIWR